MPGCVVTFANLVYCSHAGKGTPMPPVGRVLIGGSGAVTLSHSYIITGCGFPAATAGAPPCVAGMFTTGTLRVQSMGIALALIPSSAATSKTIPNATPLIPVPAGQQRVMAT